MAHTGTRVILTGNTLPYNGSLRSTYRIKIIPYLLDDFTGGEYARMLEPILRIQEI